MLHGFYEEDTNKYDTQEINETNKDMFNKLREYLLEKNYMIVFDDVWDIDFWDGVEYALPDNNKINRIMITTRNMGVAEYCGRFAPLHIHNLEPLPLNDALKLFHLKAFPFDPKGCPEELMELSEDFVKKCDGVPLAIEAIAGLLSTKRKTAIEWQKVHNSLRSKLANDPHLKYFYQVLSASYNDLPYHLKLCLLYFGIFPEDYSITCVKLTNMWIIEGFVKTIEYEDQTLEEAAEEYLVELIRRSLVKVSQVYPYGRVRRCRVHDLMHGFILKKCQELDFCQVKKTEEFSFHASTRRLSIHTNNLDANLQSAENYSRVRFCLVFNFQDPPKSMEESFLSSFKLLIGLDLEDAPLDYLPAEVGNLLHLKYLSIRNTKIKVIPQFIGRLLNLQTLDVKDSQVRELPIEINKLVKLRHIIAYSSQYVVFIRLENMLGVKLKEGIGRLRALQKLLHIDMTDGDAIINELKNLKKLRRLGIIKLRRHQGKLLCSAIESMNHLYSLCITGAEEHEILDLQTLNSPPRYLQRLYLEGRLEKLPAWIRKLKSLVKLRLNWAGLKDDPLSVLKDLPELLQLLIYNSYEGEELHFRDGWFKKLKALRLRSMPRLRSLKIEKGALPLLEELQLTLCPQMVEVPADIQNLETLKEFSVREMPDEFINDIDSMKGKSYDIIKSSPWVICVKNAEDFNVQNLGFLDE